MSTLAEEVGKLRAAAILAALPALIALAFAGCGVGEPSRTAGEARRSVALADSARADARKAPIASPGYGSAPPLAPDPAGPSGGAAGSGAPAVASPPERPASPYVQLTYQTQVLREVNLARTRPREYADIVERWEGWFDGNVMRRPGYLQIVTREGVAAVREAARFLREVTPREPVRLSEGMSWAAIDHVLDQGPRAMVGHEGEDGSQSWDRMDRYGVWDGSAGENIWYGRGSPRDVVIALIVDDGVPGRGHRQNLFDPDFRVIGVGCGSHAYYDSMCVITFAADYEERPKLP